MTEENWPDEPEALPSESPQELALASPLPNLPEQNVPEQPPEEPEGQPEESVSLDAPTELLVKPEPPEMDLVEVRAKLNHLVSTALADLEHQRASLIADIEKLERRRERIQRELKQNFVGASQDLAIRVQGFKEYLVNSLQDLATTAEQLALTPPPADPPPVAAAVSETKSTTKLHLAEDSFQEEAKRIHKLIDQYRQNPNYYGPAWQLRRTFEPIHAERVETWFFDLGGPGGIALDE